MALDNLTRLKAVPSTEPMPGGDNFELQILGLSGEDRAVHLEVAGRNERGDLVRLIDDSLFRVQGLDRELWVAFPAAWCHRR